MVTQIGRAGYPKAALVFVLAENAGGAGRGGPPFTVYPCAYAFSGTPISVNTNWSSGKVTLPSTSVEPRSKLKRFS